MRVPRRTPVQWIGLAAGTLAFLALYLLPTGLRGPDGDTRAAAAAGVAALMAIWWLTEAIPIIWTSCVPLVLYPATRVFGDDLADNVVPTVRPYVDPYIFLFMGGMCIAAAMQQCNLHRRIALGIMGWIGTGPRRLLLGVLAGTAMISMWISNTATAAMMVPIGMAVLAQSEIREGRRLASFGASLMLAIAYGANLGGIGTKIGTAPNTQFARFMAERGVDVTFVGFLAIGVPFLVFMLPIAWGVLWFAGRSDAPRGDAGDRAVAIERAALGRMKRSERVVLAVFAATAALWVAGKPLTDRIREHAGGIGVTGAHVEGSIAMAAAILLLFLRVDGRRCLEFRSLRLVPWGTLLLLGGAFSLAEGVQQSGLSAWLGGRLEVLRELPTFAQILAASLATVALSAFASNTATITVMLSVLAGVAAPAHVNSVLAAATIASSCDFMLPAGTPPNAIVFGSGYVTVARMAKTGVCLDVLAAVVAALWCSVAVPLLLP